MEITNKVGKVRIVWKNIGPCFYGLFEHYTSTLIAVIYNFLVFAQTKQIHCLEETLFILWMQKCRQLYYCYSTQNWLSRAFDLIKVEH